MIKMFDKLRKGRTVRVLGKNETPIKEATIQFKLAYSEKMYDEPMYWCHVEAIEKRKVTLNGVAIKKERFFTEGKAFFITELDY